MGVATPRLGTTALAHGALIALVLFLSRSGKQRWITAMFPSDPLKDIEQATENAGQYRAGGSL